MLVQLLRLSVASGGRERVEEKVDQVGEEALSVGQTGDRRLRTTEVICCVGIKKASHIPLLAITQTYPLTYQPNPQPRIWGAGRVTKKKKPGWEEEEQARELAAAAATSLGTPMTSIGQPMPRASIGQPMPIRWGSAITPIQSPMPSRCSLPLLGGRPGQPGLWARARARRRRSPWRSLRPADSALVGRRTGR